MIEQQNQSLTADDKWRHELKLEDARRAHDTIDAFIDKANEAAIKSSESALRACLIVNGGAAITVLSFIANIASKDSAALAGLPSVAGSLGYFAWGVVASLSGYGFAYFTHYFTAGYNNSRPKYFDHPYSKDGDKTKVYSRVKNTVHIGAVLAALASISLFVWGVISVKDAIIHLPLH